MSLVPPRAKVGRAVRYLVDCRAHPRARRRARRNGGEPVAEETLFDQAWKQWRRSLTEALASADLSARTRRALEETAAFDPADGLVDRDWALGLLAEGEPAARMRAHGLSDEEVGHLLALVRRHPAPAAGG